MSRLVFDLETILTSMLAEHRKLLECVRAHESAVRAVDVSGMSAAAGRQEGVRQRIAALENQRKNVTAQLVRSMRIDPGPRGLTLARLAELHPPRRDALLKLRSELRDVAAEISLHAKIAGRVAGAVLGHLNTALRLLAGAVGKAGLYTRQGAPQAARRIGVMEAVG